MPDWEQIVERHGPAAWKTAYRLLGNRADADECLQETFLAALDVSRRQAVDNWQALLIRVAASRAIDRLRARDRRRGREQNALSRLLRSVPAPPHQNILDREAAEMLRMALTKLPAHQAQTFCLHCLDDWSYQQIAEQLSISVNAVGVLLHRARKRLRSLMAPLAGDGSTGARCQANRAFDALTFGKEKP
jgi:RNA polymerase sigma-70 factor (ECF subfamily)